MGDEGDEERKGLSIADIMNPPRRSKLVVAHTNKGKRRESIERPQSPNPVDTEGSSTRLVPHQDTNTDRPVSGIIGNGKGKRGPEKIQRPVAN